MRPSTKGDRSELAGWPERMVEDKLATTGLTAPEESEYVAMNPLETSTIVEGQGEIHLAGVPFQPGTEVEVVVSPKACGGAPGADAGVRVRALLAALDKGRNDDPIGPLRRKELYDRDQLH
jgi:hypothetical protein